MSGTVTPTWLTARAACGVGIIGTSKSMCTVSYTVYVLLYDRSDHGRPVNRSGGRRAGRRSRGTHSPGTYRTGHVVAGTRRPRRLFAESGLQVECGVTTPSARVVYALANELGITLDSLFG